MWKLQAVCAKIPGAQAYDLVAWIKDGPIEFVCDDGTAETYAIREVCSTQTKAKLPVTCKQAIDFPSWFKGNVVTEDYVALKIDVEGAEYEILEHLVANGAMKCVDELYVEFHRKKEFSARYWSLCRVLKARYKLHFVDIPW